MKKVMFVLVMLLIVSTCFALESGPSNKVGYVKVTAAGGATPAYTPFGLPFMFWDVPTGNVPTYGVESRKPSDIVGIQANCGTGTTADRIVNQNTGFIAWRNSVASCNWTGNLETTGGNPGLMVPGHAYWYLNRSGAPRNLVLAGEADTTGAGIPGVVITAPVAAGQVATPYSWRDPREVARDRLNLLAQGFTGGTGTSSDRISAQVGGSAAYYLTGTSSWGGSLTAVVPGAAYWLINKHVGNTWTYTYLATGVPITMPQGDPELQSISTPRVKSSAKTSTATK